VVGLARSGRAVARLLAERGETVIGCDSGHPGDLAGIEDLGVEVHLDTHGSELLDSVTTVVKSPGVPGEAAVIATARERGIPVLGELELAWRLIAAPVIAVTGTNGKTTTAEMIGHLYREADREVIVAGNVGTPLAEVATAAAAPASAAVPAPDAALASPAAPDTPTVVCEASSFQLEDSVAFAPECAVFLNLAPDHIDRHGTYEAYREAKLRIFANQAAVDVAVINGEDPAAPSPDQIVARTIRFCPGGNPAGPAGGECAVSRLAGTIYALGEPLLDVTELQVLGPHNIANAMAAAAAALAMGLPREAVARGLAEFTGVAHRLEPVAEIGGTLYVNDSKATNVAAASTGLASFAVPVRAILGGSLKGEDFAALAAPVAERCAACYLTGPAAAPIELALREHGITGVEIVRCDDLAAAVGAAAAAARPGEVVLLSPGCASFDEFRDYAERGDRFRELVAGLA